MFCYFLEILFKIQKIQNIRVVAISYFPNCKGKYRQRKMNQHDQKKSKEHFFDFELFSKLYRLNRFGFSVLNLLLNVSTNLQFYLHFKPCHKICIYFCFMRGLVDGIRCFIFSFSIE